MRFIQRILHQIFWDCIVDGKEVQTNPGAGALRRNRSQALMYTQA